MKACFRFFKAPFFFVGWLAPANGMDKVNPSGITKKKGELNMKASFQIFKAPYSLLDGLRQPTGWTQSILRDLDGLRQLVIYFPTLM